MYNAAEINISEVLKEYLQAIYELSSQNNTVRTTDIAMKLGLSKPSVNHAVNSLKNAGFVSHQPYGDVKLTEKGLSYSRSVFARHMQIKRFFTDVLNVDPDDADKEAFLIEHDISHNTVEKMISFMQNQQVV